MKAASGSMPRCSATSSGSRAAGGAASWPTSSTPWSASASSVTALDGRVAVVTGASAGIGLETAKALAEAGARLALGARRSERVEALAAELPGDHYVAPLDVTDPVSSKTFVEGAVDAFGTLDILVNNAGLALGRSSIAEGTDEDDEVMLE